MTNCCITRYLLYSVSAVVLSVFIDGINISVLNTAQPEIYKFIYSVLKTRNDVKVSDEAQLNRVLNIYLKLSSVSFIGTIIGALLNGYVADRFGRKKSLIWNNAFVFLAVVLIGFSEMCNSYEMLIIGRFFIGVYSGLNTCLAPTYLTEISPIRIRGIFGSVYTLSTGLVLLVFHILQTFATFTNWVIMFSLMIIPSVLMLIILSQCQESPKFLYIINNDEISAKNVLIRLRENSEISDELEEMREEYQSIERNPRFKLTHLLINKTIRIALFITIIVILSQQLTGFRAVLFFSHDIFSRAGLTPRLASYTGIAIRIIGFTTALISVLLVDRFGRRTLLLIALLGMFCSLTLLIVCLVLKESIHFLSYLSILFVFAFVIMYSCGPVFIPNFLFAEIFRTDSRSVASTISFITLISTEVVIPIGFLPLQEVLNGFVMAVFVIFTLIFGIIILKKVPETNGKTVEEIVREL